MTKSFYIKRRKAQNIFRAFDFAESLGKPLNYFATIRCPENVLHFDHKEIRKFNKLYGRWLRNIKKREARIGNILNCRPLWTYALENPKGTNLHFHWVLHVPEAYHDEFERKVQTWSTKVNPDNIVNRLDFSKVNLKAYKKPANYMLKGVHPIDAEYFHIADICSDQGEINGQRAGFCRALGPIARKVAGFNGRAYNREKMRKLRNRNHNATSSPPKTPSSRSDHRHIADLSYAEGDLEDVTYGKSGHLKYRLTRS